MEERCDFPIIRRASSSSLLFYRKVQTPLKNKHVFIYLFIYLVDWLAS